MTARRPCRQVAELRWLAGLAVAAWALAPGPAGATGVAGVAGADTLELQAGQTEMLHYAGIRRVAVGDGKLLEVKVFRDTGELLLIALDEGVTDLRIWATGGEYHHLVRIVRRSAEDLLRQVQAHLRDIEGVSAELVGERILLRGQSLREQDMRRVEAIAAQFPQVVSYVSPGGVTLQGMIYFDARVVEVRKSSLKRIGIDWADFMDGPTYAAMYDGISNGVYRSTLAPVAPGAAQPDPLPLDAGASPHFGLSTRLGSIINLLDQDGNARTLAEPKLACRSGGTAEFLVGGEVPIPVTNTNGSTTVIFKQYGIILEIKPVADAEGYIDTHIAVEVSAIDNAVSVLGIPGFITRKAETDMNLQGGQTLVIAGLFNSDQGKEVDRLPGLGELPVLGELFKSREFRDQETELVIMVTPRLLDPDDPVNRRNIDHAARIRKQAGERLRFHLMD